MAVKLRLARYGGKKYAYYRIVAADQRSPRDGAFLEQLGTYNPNKSPAEVVLKRERINHWLGVGAQPTATVRNILGKHLPESDG